jgi:SPP1 gp7 family putative phage head morphogenesis protein
MTAPSFNRLVRLYADRMQQLLGAYRWGLRTGVAGMEADLRFYRAAMQLAKAMTKEVAGANALSWRQAAMKSSRAKEIYRGLQLELRREGLVDPLAEIAERNAQLIRSVPVDVGRLITERAAKLRLEGARPAEIERDIRQWAPELAKSRIRLIARTEIAKAGSNLTQARAEAIDLHWYQWQTSEDQRVRPSHRAMNQVLVNWNDPPSPEALVGERNTLGKYHCSCCPNCRCSPLPVADLSEIHWPAKVFTGNQIVTMNRARFAQLPGVRIAA